MVEELFLNLQYEILIFSIVIFEKRLWLKQKSLLAKILLALFAISEGAGIFSKTLYLGGSCRFVLIFSKI